MRVAPPVKRSLPATDYCLLTTSSFRRRRVDHAPHLGDGVGGEAAALRVFTHGRLVRGDVDAVDLVARDVALDPLNLRPHVPQHSARLLRDGLQLLRLQVARAGDFALDEKLRHASLLRRLSLLSGSGSTT